MTGFPHIQQTAFSLKSLPAIMNPNLIYSGSQHSLTLLLVQFTQFVPQTIHSPLNQIRIDQQIQQCNAVFCLRSFVTAIAAVMVLCPVLKPD